MSMPASYPLQICVYSYLYKTGYFFVFDSVFDTVKRKPYPVEKKSQNATKSLLSKKFLYEINRTKDPI